VNAKEQHRAWIAFCAAALRHENAEVAVAQADRAYAAYLLRSKELSRTRLPREDES
jgi:hypothetical protein